MSSKDILVSFQAGGGGCLEKVLWTVSTRLESGGWVGEKSRGQEEQHYEVDGSQED